VPAISCLGEILRNVTNIEVRETARDELQPWTNSTVNICHNTSMVYVDWESKSLYEFGSFNNPFRTINSALKSYTKATQSVILLEFGSTQLFDLEDIDDDGHFDLDSFEATIGSYNRNTGSIFIDPEMKMGAPKAALTTDKYQVKPNPSKLKLSPKPNFFSPLFPGEEPIAPLIKPNELMRVRGNSKITLINLSIRDLDLGDEDGSSSELGALRGMFGFEDYGEFLVHNVKIGPLRGGVFVRLKDQSRLSIENSDFLGISHPLIEAISARSITFERNSVWGQLENHFLMKIVVGLSDLVRKHVVTIMDNKFFVKNLSGQPALQIQTEYFASEASSLNLQFSENELDYADSFGISFSPLRYSGHSKFKTN